MTDDLKETEASDNCAINICAVDSDMIFSGSDVKEGMGVEMASSDSSSRILSGASSSESSSFDPRLREDPSRTSYFYHDFYNSKNIKVFVFFFFCTYWISHKWIS